MNVFSKFRRQNKVTLTRWTAWSILSNPRETLPDLHVFLNIFQWFKSYYTAGSLSDIRVLGSIAIRKSLLVNWEPGRTTVQLFNDLRYDYGRSRCVWAAALRPKSVNRSAWLRLASERLELRHCDPVTLITFDKQSNGGRKAVEPKLNRTCNHRMSIEHRTHAPLQFSKVRAASWRDSLHYSIVSLRLHTSCHW